ncbi:hypothetical protein A2G06_16470 (plasmid) [Geobacter anodireducens]|nr:hypothetical protein A2G06_16470 [Geobacter anodireducens]
MNEEHWAQLKEALQLALICIQENPSDSAPTRKLRAALSLLDEIAEDDCRHQQVLQKVLDAVFDVESGAILRPQPEIVELLRQEIGCSREKP